MRVRAAALAAAVLLCGAKAAAHDPFEITTDAHVSGNGGGLALHTTMSRATASRACGEARGAAFEACAGAFYQVRAGGEVLDPILTTTAPTIEGDVDIWVKLPRPTKSPLAFEAVGLRKLPPRAGVVLTVTGARTFLGQKVLRTDDSRFEVGITEEAEALGTPASRPFRRPLLIALGALATASLVFRFSRR